MDRLVVPLKVSLLNYTACSQFSLYCCATCITSCPISDPQCIYLGVSISLPNFPYLGGISSQVKLNQTTEEFYGFNGKWLHYFVVQAASDLIMAEAAVKVEAAVAMRQRVQRRTM